MEKKAAAGSDFHLPLTHGAELIIELVNLKQNIKCSVVGFESEKYLIIKIAPNDLIGSFGSDLVRETPMLVKYQHRGIVYGFKTKLLNIVPRPARLFFLSYPQKVEQYQAIDSSRYACNLPAIAMFGNQLTEMTVIDMSENGCLCTIAASPAQKALYDSVQDGKNIDLKVQLPAAGRIELSGKIRNASKDDERVLLGVKFDDMNEIVGDKLRTFLATMTEADRKQ